MNISLFERMHWMQSHFKASEQMKSKSAEDFENSTWAERLLLPPVTAADVSDAIHRGKSSLSKAIPPPISKCMLQQQYRMVRKPAVQVFAGIQQDISRLPLYHPGPTKSFMMARFAMTHQCLRTGFHRQVRMI